MFPSPLFSALFGFQQLAFDVVGLRIRAAGGGAARDKSQNLLCGSGCGVWLGGRQAGVFVASFFSPL